MRTTTVSSQTIITTGMHVTALACLGAVVAPVHADPASPATFSPLAATPSIPADTSPTKMTSPGVSGQGTGASSAADSGNYAVPRGNEMSVLAGVELERTDRRFRSRVVDWARDRSAAAGVATDFLVHGSDTGFYLRLQSRSEYVVRWETRF